MFTSSVIEEVVVILIAFFAFVMSVAVDAVFHAFRAGRIDQTIAIIPIALLAHSTHTVCATLHSAVQAFSLHYRIISTRIAVQTLPVIHKIVLLLCNTGTTLPPIYNALIRYSTHMIH